MQLTDKVALVTAAGRGIGRAIALRLAAEGASVVVNSFSADTTESTVAAIKTAGGTALPFVADITDPEQMLAMRDLALNECGQIDILVNNVGAGPKEAIAPEAHELGMAAGVWDALYGQNLRPVVLMSEAVVPHMRERGTGKIVHISSIAGRASLSDQMLTHFVHPSYGAMKAALVSFTQTQAELLGPANINVNAVAPGIVYTDAWAGNAQRAVETMEEFKGQDPRSWFEGIARGDYPHIFDRTPLRREQTVEDIGNAVLFLVSDNALNITGQCLMVDGGMVKA
ncbi:MAG: SDR family NAD(P)-dependent oxidoreductase [Pseudomonadota bacterium]